MINAYNRSRLLQFWRKYAFFINWVSYVELYDRIIGILSICMLLREEDKNAINKNKC